MPDGPTTKWGSVTELPSIEAHLNLRIGELYWLYFASAVRKLTHARWLVGIALIFLVALDARYRRGGLGLAASGCLCIGRRNRSHGRRLALSSLSHFRPRYHGHFEPTFVHRRPTQCRRATPGFAIPLRLGGGAEGQTNFQHYTDLYSPSALVIPKRCFASPSNSIPSAPSWRRTPNQNLYNVTTGHKTIPRNYFTNSGKSVLPRDTVSIAPTIFCSYFWSSTP